MSSEAWTLPLIVQPDSSGAALPGAVGNDKAKAAKNAATL